jgi:toxin ParE1/3/4
MAKFELSRAADRDLADIVTYTIRQHGERQADRYLVSLEACFQRLADRPLLARPANRLRPGYRRFEHASHVIFFTIASDGIHIVRVLHQRMDPRNYL